VSKRNPGVTRLPSGLLQIRWTAYRSGNRVDRIETLPPETTIAEAVERRARKIREAQAALVETTTPVPKRDQRMTLGAFARSWLADKLSAMKPSTRENYATALTLHILPMLGDVRLCDLARADIQRWVSWAETATFVPRTRHVDDGAPEIEPQPYARAAVLSWWAKVRQLCRDAAADHGLRDPTERVPGPKCYGRTKVREQRTLGADELRALLDAIPSSWHAEVYTIALTGVRPGELYALTWPDVDLERRSLRVARSHHMGAVGATKTGAERHIPIPAGLVGVLRAHRAAMLREQHPALHTGIVFPSTEDGRGWHRLPQSLRTTLDRARRAIGLSVRVTPQVLRRTLNTRLVELGYDRLLVRDVTGHSSEQMTGLYYASRTEARAQALDEVEAAIVGPDCGTAARPETRKPR